MLASTGLCAPAAVADKGGEPHDGSHGQGRQEEPAERAPAWGAGDAAEHRQQPAEPSRREGPAQRKQGKAPKRGRAKKEHHPAPAEAPKVVPAAPAPLAASKGTPKTTICHHTGSQSNPWVRITVANPALKAHRRHGDLIPAPASGCPKAAAASTHDEPEAGGPPPVIVTNPEPPASETPPASPPAVETAVRSPSSRGEVLAARAQGTGAVPTTVSSARARERVLAARASAPSAVAAARTASSGSRMPYTGLMAWLVAVAGAAALLAGVALRRAHGTRRV
jgi:hypothetical protein